MISNLDKIISFLNEWEKLTLQEAESIDQDLWDAVLSVQNTKKELQKKLDSELSLFKSKPESSSDYWKIKQRIDRLVELEKQNKIKLENKMQRAVGEYGSMKTKMENLKKIRSAYGEANLPSWQAYT